MHEIIIIAEMRYTHANNSFAGIAQKEQNRIYDKFAYLLTVIILLTQLALSCLFADSSSTDFLRLALIP